MKALLIASLTALAVLSSAESADAPHVLYSSGTIFDVGYEFEMGQPTVGIDAKGAKYVSTRGCVKITASQSSQTLRLAANAINGPGPFNPIKWQVHRCPKGGGGGGAGGILSFLLTGITALELPALDADAKEAAYFEIEMGMQDVHFDGFAAPSSSEKYAIKNATKAWLPSNFKVNIGSSPARASKVSPITIKQMNLDFYGLVDEIVITIPTEDSGPYVDWYNKVAAGGSDVRPMTIEYDDADGLPVLTVTVNVEITSAYFADVLGGTDTTSGRDFRVAFRAVNNPGVK